MDDKTGIIIACSIILLIGLRLLYSSIIALSFYYRLRSNGQRTKAVISGLEHKKLTLLSRGGDAPVLTFQANSQTVSGVAVNSIYSDIGFYKIGTHVEIYHDKDNPVLFVIKNRKEQILAIFILLVSLFVLTISIWGIIKQIG